MEVSNEATVAVKAKRPRLFTDDSTESEGAKSEVLKYLQQIPCVEKPLGVVAREHSYTRAWSCEFEGTLCKPAKLLFLRESWKHIDEAHYETGDELSVDDEETREVKPNPFWGVGRDMMKGMEKSLAGIKCNMSDDWEEQINKDGWTMLQSQIFNKATKILQSDQLARLSLVDNPNEPVLVRNQVSASAKRFRQLFSSFSWDSDMAQWLHQTIVSSVSKKYLVAYLEILQTLRFKIPPLIDKMLASTPALEALPKLSQRPWDPVAQLLAQNKPNKLPNNPLFVLFTGVPTTIRLPPIKRAAAWINLFNQVGKVVPINVHSVSHPGMMEVAESMQAVIMTGRAKVRELKAHCPNRPIILLGTNTGSLLALQVAALETVAAVICLGYPSQSVEGGRGAVGDKAVEFKASTLFVTGTHAQNSHPDVIDKLRDRLKVETGHLIVGGADEWLRMSKDKRKIEGVTQSMVDRAIFEEICSFLLNSLFSDITPSISDASFLHPSSPSKVLLKSANNKPRLEAPKPPPGAVSHLQYTSATSASFTFTTKQPPKQAKKGKHTDGTQTGLAPLEPTDLPSRDMKVVSEPDLSNLHTVCVQEPYMMKRTEKARPVKVGFYKNKVRYFPDDGPKRRFSGETSVGSPRAVASPTPSVSQALLNSVSQTLNFGSSSSDGSSVGSPQAFQARHLSDDRPSHRSPLPRSQPVSPEKNVKHHRKSPIVHRHGVGSHRDSPPPIFTKTSNIVSVVPPFVEALVKRSRLEDVAKSESDFVVFSTSTSS